MTEMIWTGESTQLPVLINGQVTTVSHGASGSVMSQHGDEHATVRSLCSNESPAPTAGRRAGYVKPASQPFSNSALNRSSVMALGRIDHLQHHFAKTGKLDRRSGVVLKPGERIIPHRRDISGQSLESTSSDAQISEEDGDEFDHIEPTLVPLPPSPIRHEYVRSVRRDVDPKLLRTTLQQQINFNLQRLALHDLDADTRLKDSHELALQFVNEIATCIRSARTYSIRIPLYESLDASFVVFREEAIGLLGTLKAITERVGEDGLRDTEKVAIRTWLEHVATYLENENTKQVDEAMNWTAQEKWTDQESQRFVSFLKFHDFSAIPMQGDDLTSDVLREMSSGLRLCMIFNAVVQRSRKPFGFITRFHQNTSIRYRVLDNLRYWQSAVKYRFGVDLGDLPYNEIFDFSAAGESSLRVAIITFCRAALQELLEPVPEEGTTEETDKDNLRLAAQVEDLEISDQTDITPTHLLGIS